MSRIHILFATLGLAAAVGIPAIALASSGGSEQSCCKPQTSCCSKEAACCEEADPAIACPTTGEKITASECPVCCKKAE